MREETKIELTRYACDRFLSTCADMENEMSPFSGEEIALSEYAQESYLIVKELEAEWWNGHIPDDVIRIFTREDNVMWQGIDEQDLPYFREMMEQFKRKEM